MDPRRAPLDPFELEHAPALPAERLSIDEVRRRFACPPPWQPEFVDDAYHSDAKEAYTMAGDILTPCPAAVLIPLIERPSGVSLVLTLRSQTLLKHSGQVAFPGGRVDATDASVIATALRETREEIGIESEAVEVLGKLPVYCTGTGYRITPVVGRIDSAVMLNSLRIEPAEVAEVFEVPLSFLMNPANHQRRLFSWTQDDVEFHRTFLTMPWRPDPGQPQEYFIWGATAAMLRNLYRFLAAE